MNMFRVQFLMERLVPEKMTGTYDEAYLKNLTEVRFLLMKPFQKSYPC